MHGDSFDEEHIDPHGECAAEIRHLQAERDSLAAQLAVACESLTEAHHRFVNIQRSRIENAHAFAKLGEDDTENTLSTLPASASALIELKEAAWELLCDLDHEDAEHGPTVSIVEKLRRVLASLSTTLIAPTVNVMAVNTSCQAGNED